MLFRVTTAAALLLTASIGVQAAPRIDVPQRKDPLKLLGVDNGLARTPPMGWNSWNQVGCKVNEKVVRDAADAMVSSGMRDAGYRYIVIDDCWQIARDAAGTIVEDKSRFPAGMKALADYVHAKGLNFGIYSDAGEFTCAKRPGSRGHEVQDAKQYATWGVDFLKYDWCNTATQDPKTSYFTMSKALQETGRPIVFNMCEWGASSPWLWATNVGNLWRTTGDIFDKWEGYAPEGHAGMGVMNILDLQVGLASFSGPGHWNDPDMLEVGNGGMTDAEYRAHFSLWAILAAPLMAGNDLSKMDAATKTILMNKEVIAIDQDPLGMQADRVAKDGDAEVWARPIAGGGRAVVLLNRSTTPRDITVTWASLLYPDHFKGKVRDLWKHTNLPDAKGHFTARVEGHSVVMITIKP